MRQAAQRDHLSGDHQLQHVADLGSGGFGTTLLLRDGSAAEARPVALKVLITQWK